MSVIKSFSLVLVTFISINAFSQNLTGKELLDKAIKYHDPNSNWASFNGELSITMEIPDKPSIPSHIKIDLPNEYFKVETQRDTNTISYSIYKDSCSYTLNASKNITEEHIKKFNLNCKRANLLKNYYTYLYGLPMKLKDPGTQIDTNVESKRFKGRDYWVLKVSYDAEVGSDVWHFYFNTKTYAMEIYQFFKTDENGLLNKNSGEYILLTEEKMVNGIKMPKNRAWYYNKNDKLLGTDILN